jgi:hypothetical protein
MSQQLSTVAMNPAEQALLQGPMSRITILLAASDRFVRSSTEPPVAGFPMGSAKKAQLYDAYEQAYRLLFSAEDHLRTVLSVFTGKDPLPIFSPFTLLRAAADPLMRCRHLLDSGLSESDRLARGLNERLDNLKEQRKAHALLPGQVLNAQTHYDNRVADLENRAKANGIKPKPDSKGKTIGFNETVAEDIELFAAYLPGGAGSLAFRVLSGYVHSKPWIQYDPSDAQATSDPNWMVIPKSLDVPTFAAVLKAVLSVHDTCIGQWLALAGYPPSVWYQAKGGS